MGAHEAVDPRDEPAFVAWRRSGGSRGLVVFEAIGVPGIINDILRARPGPVARVVVVGVCMEPDTINPFFGIARSSTCSSPSATTRWSSPASLRHIAEGEIDVAPMITGEVGLDGVGAAFDALANPDEHCKILVTP